MRAGDDASINIRGQTPKSVYVTALHWLRGEKPRPLGYEVPEQPIKVALMSVYRD